MGRMPDSSVAMMSSSSSGIGYISITRQWWNVKEGLFTYPPIDFELVCFVLLLHHEQRMVKQEHQQLSAIAL